MEVASAPNEEVKPVTSGPSFTPSIPSGPTFSPTRPSGPAFTPSKPASPTFTPNRPSTPSSTPTSSTARATVSGASQPKTTPVTSSPRPSFPTTPQNTNNSGCLGILVGIVVVISALLFPWQVFKRFLSFTIYRLWILRRFQIGDQGWYWWHNLWRQSDRGTNTYQGSYTRNYYHYLRFLLY